MRHLIALAVLVAPLAHAAPGTLLETRDEARQRQSAENYRIHQERRPMIPPTYQRPLGDPPMPGVERPGYVTPSPYPYNSRD